MDSRKYVFKETLIVFVGEALCVAVMLGIFALLNRLDRTVLFGGILGGIVAVSNFFFMAVGATLAADKAEEQNVKGGQAIIRSSYLLRMVAMAVILFAGLKSGLCNPFALVIPLVFVRPVLMIGEFFRKSGDNKS